MIGPATIYPLLACLAAAIVRLPVVQIDPLPGPPRGGPPRSAESLVKVQASADAAPVHPGQTFDLAVAFAIDPGWHIYWENPGDSGMPTRIDVTAPAGFTTDAVRFPRPMVIHGPDGLTYGYERQVVLFVPVTAPASLPAGTVTFQVNVTWLVCRKACLLGSVRRAVSVATTDAPAPAPPVTPPAGERADEIDMFRARLPRPLENLEGASIELRDGSLVVSGPAGDHEEVGLYPIEVPGVTFDRPAVRLDGGRFQVTAPVEIRPGNALGQPMAIRGLLILGRDLDDPCYDLRIPLDRSGGAARVDAPAGPLPRPDLRPSPRSATMKPTLTTILTLGLAVAALTVAASAQTTRKATAKAKLGEPAPGFTLTDTNGESHSLKDFAGKTLVLQWFNPDCPFIVNTYKGATMKKTLAHMKELGDDYVFVGVNSTANRPAEYIVSSSNAFMKEHETEIPMLVDADGAVGRMYDARTTPHIFIIDAAGVLRYHGAFTDDPIGRKSDGTNHVIVALDQISAGETVSPDRTKPWGCSVKYRKKSD